LNSKTTFYSAYDDGIESVTPLTGDLLVGIGDKRSLETLLEQLMHTKFEGKQYTGDILCKHVNCSKVSCSGKISGYGITSDNTLNVKGEVFMKNTLEVGGSVVMETNLVVKGPVVMEKTLNVTGPVICGAGSGLILKGTGTGTGNNTHFSIQNIKGVLYILGIKDTDASKDVNELSTYKFHLHGWTKGQETNNPNNQGQGQGQGKKKKKVIEKGIF
jgi:hypothetical protein